MAFADILSAATLAEVQNSIATFAALGRLYITQWASGTPAEQFFQAISRAIQASGLMSSAAIRGQYLDYAVDPGDDDPYDPGNISLTPAPGWLSALGLNSYGTERRGETYANTPITLTNTGSTPHYLTPFGVIVARSGHPETTYRNSADASVYTGSGGTYALAPGASVSLSFSAESPGAASSAGFNELTVVVSGQLGVTATNPAAAIGEDREDAPAYRIRCRQQSAATSPNGAADAYRYFATTALDGTPLLRPDGAAVGITRIYVSQASISGIVNVYYADDDGPADADDVTAANENITLNAIAVPDCITFGPDTTGGLAAAASNITVTWAVEYQLRYAGKAVLGSTVKAAIVAALTARFTTYPIGGFDVVGLHGTIYAEDIRATVKGAHPAIYNATISAPAGDTSITLGHVAVLTSPTGTETGS